MWFIENFTGAEWIGITAGVVIVAFIVKKVRSSKKSSGKCPQGYFYDVASGKCVLITDVTEPNGPRPTGDGCYDPAHPAYNTDHCKSIRDGTFTPCGEGRHWDEESGECVDDDFGGSGGGGTGSNHLN